MQIHTVSFDKFLFYSFLKYYKQFLNLLACYPSITAIYLNFNAICINPSSSAIFPYSGYKHSFSSVSPSIAKIRFSSVVPIFPPGYVAVIYTGPPYKKVKYYLACSYSI